MALVDTRMLWVMFHGTVTIGHAAPTATRHRIRFPSQDGRVGQRTNRGKASHAGGRSRFRLAPPTCENGDINARKGGTVMASSPSHCGTRRAPRHLPPLPGLRPGRALRGRAARPTRCLGIPDPWPSPVPNRQGKAPISANFGHRCSGDAHYSGRNQYRNQTCRVIPRLRTDDDLHVLVE